MELLVLGSGSSVPHPRRSSSGYWLQDEIGSVLLDCSAAGVHRMAQEGCDWVNLDAVWVSHFHLDHCGGLAPLLFGTKHAPETQSREKPMRILGPHGLRKLIAAFDAAYDYGLFRQPFPLDIVEVEAGVPFEIAGMNAEAFSTPHTVESLSIRFTGSAGRSLAYTSDTGYSSGIVEFARGVDLLLAECSFVERSPVKIHLKASDIRSIAERAAPKRIVLTHFYPEWDGQEEKALKMLAGLNVELAFDGMRLKI